MKEIIKFIRQAERERIIKLIDETLKTDVNIQNGFLQLRGKKGSKRSKRSKR